MERRDPTLYYGTKQFYFGSVNFKITGGGNLPPYEDVLQKRLRKTRVKSCSQTKSHMLDLYLNFLKSTHKRVSYMS